MIMSGPLFVGTATRSVLCPGRRVPRQNGQRRAAMARPSGDHRLRMDVAPM
ncbi:hypothetical protein SFR_1634 [Streptomyces sp. FR-008]|nr:hypothetical protein SFR_1634 [Streptomyces sp. FR-008]